MESKRIKSAWEIALERAERLGSLSADELRSRQEEEWREIGRALAARWLSGLPERDLKLEVSRQDEARQAIVLRQAVESLAAALSLRPDVRSERALEGLRVLISTDVLRPLESRVRAVWREHAEAVNREREKLESRMQKSWERELRGRGLSGTAIVPNTDSWPEWQAALRHVESESLRRLSEAQREVKELC